MPAFSNRHKVSDWTPAGYARPMEC